ncbi:replication factor RFC1 C terminal domain-containing protein [Limtongia smithiae]|uniref:replication factor RFC1 C terminal domain-containing protein n=1 Tax=Limtongia smithiae TaxID=1125753 RepID=UPI0034CDE4E2
MNIDELPKKKFNPYEFKARQSAVQVSQIDDSELPVGAPNCLAGLTFVFTGVLETLSREQGVELVKRYGGRVTGGPSSKTSYVVLGEEAGPKKIEVIKKLNLKTIDQNQFFDLIRDTPANGGNTEAGRAAAEKQRKEEAKIVEMAKAMDVVEALPPRQAPAASPSTAQLSSQPSSTPREPAPTSLLWTDKYAPRSVKDICGNKAVVQRLQSWLEKWDDSLKSRFSKPGPEGSGIFRAVMISGPPGIGKTTAAHLVANLAGYDVIETNASDARSKNIIADTFAGVLDNSSMLGYFGKNSDAPEKSKRKILLIMDEVDGMSAGDRGGVGQMVQVCKSTHIPVILICNDYGLPKMRPFDKVAFALPFRRPDANAIRSRIMSIAFREGLKVPAAVIDQLVAGSHSDIRQIINLLSTFKVTGSDMDFNQGKKMSKDWEKHVIMKPFDIASQLLGGQMFSRTSHATLNDKLELYFNDHDFTPLMIQENYLRARTANGGSKAKTLEIIDRAASSISDADLCDRMVHGSQPQWSLMPFHGIMSTVRPASFMASGSGSGGPGERFIFTSWLGSNSKRSKLMRYLQEIQAHTRLRISGDRTEVRLQYLSAFFDNLYTPIAKRDADGIAATIQFMDDYYLTREDFDAILELGIGPRDGETLWKKISTSTKTAFTRKYNSTDHPVPFMRADAFASGKATSTVKREIADLEEALDDVIEADEVTQQAEDEKADAEREEKEMMTDLSKDRYIKKPAATKKAAAGTKKAAAVDGAVAGGAAKKVAKSRKK